MVLNRNLRKTICIVHTLRNTPKLVVSTNQTNHRYEMNAHKSIEVKIITNQLKFFIFTLVYLASTIAITIYFFFETSSVIILIVGIILLTLFPVTFPNLFRTWFLKKVNVVLTENSFSITPLEFESNHESLTIQFDNIKFFKIIESDKNDFSMLKITLLDGTKYKFIFSGQENISQSETDINGIFKKHIVIYNSSKEHDDKIRIAPSFLTTRTALYLHRVIAFIMIAVTVYFGYNYPKTLFVSVGFLPIYYTMVLIRKRAIKEKELFD